ncbi:hypothetical protein TNCV_3100141, partial [Trichonephila clavipes]
QYPGHTGKVLQVAPRAPLCRDAEAHPRLLSVLTLICSSATFQVQRAAGSTEHIHRQHPLWVGGSSSGAVHVPRYVEVCELVCGAVVHIQHLTGCTYRNWLGGSFGGGSMWLASIWIEQKSVRPSILVDSITSRASMWGAGAQGAAVACVDPSVSMGRQICEPI